MDISFSQFLSGSGQFVLVTLIAFGFILFLKSYLRFQKLADAAQKAIEAGEGSPDIFEIQLTRALSKNREAMSAMLIHSNASEKIRAILRKTDLTMKYDDQTVGVLLDAPAQGARVAAERLRSALMATVDVVSHPENGSDAKTLHAALKQSPGIPSQATVEAMPATSHMVDPLTGVLKSTHIGREFQKYVAQYRRQDQATTFLYFDIDHMQKYNAQYGEKVGDEILKAFSNFLQSAVREGDLIGRAGGDDFLIARPGEEQDGLNVAKRLIELVRKYEFKTSSATLRATVSMGIAVSPNHGVTGRQLYQAAETACRVAKAKGRNVYVLYDASMHLAKSAQEPTDSF